MNTASNTSKNLEWLWAMLFITLAMVCAGLFSYQSTRFIPSIHDETSYLFQAKTFLMGRVTNPVHPEHLFFDQYHVINEKIFASKYFPGFAITLMPFVLFGQPFLNPIFFYGLQLLLIFLIGKELYGKRTAWCAMILAAVSPQILMQTCFLLSHVPNSVFLLLFFYGFIRSEQKDELGWIVPAAFSWGMSFLIRPVTAIGFALPVAVLLLYRILKKETEQPLRKFFLWAIPVLISLTAYFVYNHAVTGNFLKSPFDYYAEIHAPFHRYGFNVWEKFAGQAKGPRVDQWFNEYYHNHTPLIGLQFTGLRLSVLVQFLFGSMSVGMLLMISWIIGLRKKNSADILIFFIWLSLQLLYLPHWYPGVLTFGSNYLYEVSGLLILSLINTLLIFLKNPKLEKFQKIVWPIFMIVFVLTSARMEKSLSHEVRSLKSLKIWLFNQMEQKKIDKAVVFLNLPDEPQINWNIMDNSPNLDTRIVYALDRGNDNQKLKPYFTGYVFVVWNVETGTLETI